MKISQISENDQKTLDGFSSETNVGTKSKSSVRAGKGTRKIKGGSRWKTGGTFDDSRSKDEEEFELDSGSPEFQREKDILDDLESHQSSIRQISTEMEKTQEFAKDNRQAIMFLSKRLDQAMGRSSE